MVNKNTQKVFNNSLSYTIGTVASKAVSFFLVPLCTRFIDTDDYGIATTIIMFVSTFGIVIILSLRAALIRFYNDYDAEKKKVFVGSITLVVLFNAVLICGLLMIFHPLYAPYLFPDIDFFPLLFFGILSLGFEGVYLIYQSTLQARQEGKIYSLNSIIYLLFYYAVILIAVVGLRLGALGMVLANCIANFAFAVYGLISMYLKKIITFKFDYQIAVHSLKYSLPILPHNLSNGLKTYSTKVIINSFLSYTLSGFYALASQFSTILSMVQASINLAFRPWFVEQMKRGDEGRKEIKSMTNMIMSLYSFCAVGISLFSKEIVLIFAAGDYRESWKYIPILVVCQLITFIYYSHVQSLMYNLKYSKYVFVCSFGGVLANVVFGVLLVKSLNIYGVLLAHLIADIILCVLTVWLSNKAENVDFGLGKMLLSVILSIVLIAVGVGVTIFFAEKLWIAIIIKIFMVLIAFLCFIKEYLADYISLFSNLFKKKIKK